MGIQIKGKLGEWKKFTGEIGELLSGEAQEVAVGITYQAKDGTQIVQTMKHKDFVETDEEEEDE